MKKKLKKRIQDLIDENEKLKFDQKVDDFKLVGSILKKYGTVTTTIERDYTFDGIVGNIPNNECTITFQLETQN